MIVKLEVFHVSLVMSITWWSYRYLIEILISMRAGNPFNLNFIMYQWCGRDSYCKYEHNTRGMW